VRAHRHVLAYPELAVGDPERLVSAADLDGSPAVATGVAAVNVPRRSVASSCALHARPAVLALVAAEAEQ